MFDDVANNSTPATDAPTAGSPVVRRSFNWRSARKIAVGVLGLGAYAFSAQLAANDVIVQPGDTLTKIAGEYQTSVGAIAAYNGLKNPNLIISGQTLVIPPTSGELTHKVRAGDSLSLIASLYNSSVDAIGNTLIIPLAGAPTEPTPAAAPEPEAAPAETIPPPVEAPTTTVAPAAPATQSAETPATAPPTTEAPASTVPATTVAPAPTVTPQPIVVGTGIVSTMWVVQPGDTIASIALRFDISAKRLAEVNVLAETDALVPGQRIYVPQR